MQNKKSNIIKSYLKLFLWAVGVQLLLINISAAIYAYKLTHFYQNDGKPQTSSKNIFTKTWKLFVGNTLYKQSICDSPAFAFETIKLRTKDNISIEAWYGGADSSKGCVVFLHGVTVNKASMLDEATVIRNWGFNVLLVDFRGHGNSEGSSTSFGVSETEDVTAAVDYVKGKGARNIILYGCSLGAVVIMKAVGEGLVHPAAVITDIPFATLQDHLKAKANTLGFPAQPFAFLVTMWIGLEKGYNGFGHNASAYAKGVHCPVLLQWGEQDRYVKKSEINAIYKGLPGQKNLVVYPTADHESFLRHDPMTWKKEVGTFLLKNLP